MTTFNSVGMTFYEKLLIKNNLEKHDERPLWRYNLEEDEFNDLKRHLNNCTSLRQISHRDATLYFAEWWKRDYSGGSPKIQNVFSSFGKFETADFNAQSFFELAKSGAQIMGIRWIKKQNTLFFRTLLLQGGIPIKHISENKSYYQSFLLGLIDLRPNTIEEIILQHDLTKLLPISSRNETIYENCLAIINSILNDEDTYTSLFERNNALREIKNALQIRKLQLNKSARVVRPKIFWVMNFGEAEAKIHLRMGFSAKYTSSSMSEILKLSAPAEERTYNLYLDDWLICTFKKTLSGDYRTEWENQKFYYWNTSKLSPQFYCVCNDERWEVDDLISVYPTIEDPTLWTDLGDNGWRLVKGNSTNSANGLLLLPEEWQHTAEHFETITVDSHRLRTIQFEGEVNVIKADFVYKFCSNVDSFEWAIRTEKPSWMRKAEIVVVSRHLKLHVYDHEGKIRNANEYKVYFRSASNVNSWQLSDGFNPLPIGLINIKIEFNGIIAYDSAFNIGSLNLEISGQTFNCASLIWHNLNSFRLSVTETNKYDAVSNNNSFNVTLNTSQPSIPDYIPFKLKFGNQKALQFDILAPFSGFGLIDKNGAMIDKEAVLTLNNLHGIRILTTHVGETVIRFWNVLRDEVKISKIVHFAYQPLINFKEEIQRLLFLADVMRHDNRVIVELTHERSKQSYFLKGFSHQLNDISNQFERKVRISEIENSIQLFAIPLNCKLEEIEIFSLQGDDGYQVLPESVENGQFILFSENSNGMQMQPRFINTEPTFEGKSSSERIKNYHEMLLESDYSTRPWNELQAYYNICVEQQIPFSTFDQIRAISHSSRLAAKAFFFFGINQKSPDEFIQVQATALEQDLGFCFHWIEKQHWELAINQSENWIGTGYILNILTLMAKYFQETNLEELHKFIVGEGMVNVRVNNQVINVARAQLGARVLSELPQHTPHTTRDYGIAVNDNYMVKLLLRAPIAVAESIRNTAERSIWDEGEFVSNLRRNIQYAQYVAPDLYTKVLYHCLSY